MYMHTPHATLLKDPGTSFYAECPAMQSALAEDFDMSKQLEILATPLDSLKEFVIPEAKPAYLCPANAMFPSDPAASVMVVLFSYGVSSQLKTHALRKPMVEASALLES